MIENADALVLWLFCVLAIAAAGLVYLFFISFQQHREPLRWSKLMLGNLLILLFAISASLLGGEVYYRFLVDDLDGFVMSKVTRRWSQRHFKLNEFGFRDSVEYSRRIPAGWRRVTFLGEAFTVGHGVADVEQRFANRVRRALGECEVHVIAEPAWDTGQHVWIASGLPADGFDLDLVVLVYSLDDLMDSADDWQSLQERMNDPGKLRFFVNHSYLINSWYYWTKAARQQRITDSVDLLRDSYAGSLWTTQRERLVSLQEAIESFDGQLLAVTVPHFYALDGEYPYRQIHLQLGQFWSQRGVPHLDLLAVFNDEQAKQLIRGRSNAYPNERAHQLAADALVEFLQPHLKHTPG